MNHARETGNRPPRVDLRRPAVLINSDGIAADVTVLDLDKPWKVDPGRFASRSRNTPFGGWKGRGTHVLTVVGGRVAWSAARVSSRS